MPKLKSTVDTKSIKSAVRLEGDDEVQSHIRTHFAEEGVDDGAPVREMVTRDDGRNSLVKRIPGLCRNFDQMPSPDEVRRMAEATGVVWDDSMTGRAVRFIASDERVDRDGDILLQNWDFEDFSKNPVVPWSHKWWDLPIGSVIDWRVVRRSSADYDGPVLEVIDLFAPPEVYAFADTVFRLISAGIIRTGSVGFYPKVIVHVEDPEERSELGLGRWGVVFEEAELLEHSPTTIPANPGATVAGLRSAKSADQIMPHDITVLRDLSRQSALRDGMGSKDWREIDAHWRSAWASLFPDVSVDAHADIDVPLALTCDNDAMRKSIERLQAAVDSMARSSASEADRISGQLDEIKSAGTSGLPGSGVAGQNVGASTKNHLDEILRGSLGRVEAASERMKAIRTDAND